MTQITKLAVEDYKGVRRIELEPDGSLVVIAGGNGQGKSSFIDAIAELIDPKGTKLTSKPIRDGAERAVATLTTTEFIAERVWSKDGDPGRLTVRTLDGARYDKAADFMRKVTGAGLFDPFAYVELPEKQQRQQLLARVELPFDLDEVDAERRRAFDERTEVNRDLARAEAKLTGYAEPRDDLPEHEVSVTDLLAEAEAAREHNASLSAALREAERLQGAREAAERAVVEAEDALARAKAAQHAAAKAEIEHTSTVAALPEPIDVAAITAKLVDVETVNREVREAAARAAVAAEAEQHRARAAALTESIEAIDARKAAALRDAAFPVPGLSVDDDGVTFEGVPFKQVNTARQHAIAFDLVTAGEPRLRIAQIKNGDALDANTLAEIRKVADERGFIVLIERDRDESRQIGFEIREGVLA